MSDQDSRLVQVSQFIDENLVSYDDFFGGMRNFYLLITLTLM